jgi:hypothetical protein
VDADRSTVGWHVAAKQALNEGLQMVQRKGGVIYLIWVVGNYRGGRRVRSGKWGEAVEMVWQGYTS